TGSGNASVRDRQNYAGFSWSIANGTISGPANGAYVSYVATTANPVHLSVVVSDFNGCTGTQSVDVPIRTIPAPSIAQSGAPCPHGTSTMASVDNANSYNTFSWSIINGAFDGASNQSSVSFHATSNNPVEVSVTVTDFGGCSASSSITVPIRTLSA